MKLAERPSLVSRADLVRLLPATRAHLDLLDSLPGPGGEEIRRLVRAIDQARRGGRHVVMGIGGHVVKTGCGPVVADLIRRRVVTAVCMPRSAAIHDAELAIAGRTSEDVAAGLSAGSYGTTEETGALFARAAEQGALGEGLGRALGGMLAGAEHTRESVLAEAFRAGIPATVHAAIGTDTVDVHPAADGAATGAATMADFRILRGVVADLAGGVHLNCGSAVVLPEVFLKCVAAARAAGRSLDGLVTANLDQLRHYRPTMNVLRRPAGGLGIDLAGRHELLLPLLRLFVLAERGRNSPAEPGAKVATLGQAIAAATEVWRRGGRVVFTNGCFDVLHAGHVRLIEGARALGDVLIVGLNADDSVARLKGPGRPVNRLEHRAEVLAALSAVDLILPFFGDSPESVVSAILPDVLVKGGDYEGRKVVGRDWVEARGGRVVLLPLIPGLSTSRVVAAGGA